MMLPLFYACAYIRHTRAGYSTRHNLGFDVPYTPYENGPINLPTASSSSGGDVRPVWKLLENHYGPLKGLNVTLGKIYRDMVISAVGGADGGEGAMVPTGGRYDQLRRGTLMHTLQSS